MQVEPGISRKRDFEPQLGKGLAGQAVPEGGKRRVCAVAEQRDVAAILRRKRIEYVVKREAVDHLRSPGLRLGFAFPLLLRL